MWSGVSHRPFKFKMEREIGQNRARVFGGHEFGLFCTLSDERSKKDCPDVFTYESPDAARTVVNSLMDGLQRGLGELGVDCGNFRDPVMIIGPTAVIKGKNPASTYPEVDRIFRMLPKAERFYLIEPNSAWFPDLADYALTLPPDMQKRLVLVNEKMHHLLWDNQGGKSGIPDGEVGLTIANNVFDMAITPPIPFRESVGELSRVTQSGGLIATHLVCCDEPFGNFHQPEILGENSLYAVRTKTPNNWGFARKISQEKAP
jgi:hypothetical protein